MKVFLIILAVLALLLIAVLNITAEFTIIFDNGWTTRVKVLFYEKDVKLSELLNFILLPEKAGADAARQVKEKKKQAAKQSASAASPSADETAVRKVILEPHKPPKAVNLSEAEAAELLAAAEDIPQGNEAETENQSFAVPQKISAPAKETTEKSNNYLQAVYEKDGIAGIGLLVSNLLQTVHSALTTFMKGLHIYSLYVKMIIGGGDAADIGEKYGAVCGWYYSLKGMILNQMKVEQYDDFIQPDFIAPRSEYEFQLIGALSVGLLFKVLLKAGKVFLVNFIKNK